eukprot:s714_g7.t1
MDPSAIRSRSRAPSAETVPEFRGAVRPGPPPGLALQNVATLPNSQVLLAQLLEQQQTQNQLLSQQVQLLQFNQLAMSQAAYTNPTDILCQVDPTLKSEMEQWAKEYRAVLQQYCTQDTLHAKYLDLTSKGELHKQFADEVNKVWQWPSMFKAEVREFETCRPVITEELHLRLPAMKYYKSKADASFQEGLLLDRFQAWTLKHAHILNELSRKQIESKVRLFAELTFRTELPRIQSRHEKEKEKRKKQREELLQAEAAFRLMDINKLLAMAMLERSALPSGGQASNRQQVIPPNGAPAFFLHQYPDLAKKRSFWSDDYTIDFDEFVRFRLKRMNLVQLERRFTSPVHVLTSPALHVPAYVRAYLAKGSKFIPDRKPSTAAHLVRAVDSFERCIQVAAFFKDKQSHTIHASKCRMRSSWSPTYDPWVSLYCRLLKEELIRYQPLPLIKNEDFVDRAARRWLTQNSDLVCVVDADKNLGDAILPKAWVKSEVSRLLAEAAVLIMPEDFTNMSSHIKFALDSFLHRAHVDGLITTKVLKFLLKDFNSNKAGSFRLRVKLHKTPIVGRPIMNLSRTWIAPAATYLTEMLNPAQKRLPHVIESSTDLLKLLGDMQVPDGFVLFTFDVRNLYPSIDRSHFMTVIDRQIKRLWSHDSRLGSGEWLTAALHVCMQEIVSELFRLQPGTALNFSDLATTEKKLLEQRKDTRKRIGRIEELLAIGLGRSGPAQSASCGLVLESIGPSRPMSPMPLTPLSQMSPASPSRPRNAMAPTFELQERFRDRPPMTSTEQATPAFILHFAGGGFLTRSCGKCQLCHATAACEDRFSDDHRGDPPKAWAQGLHRCAKVSARDIPGVFVPGDPGANCQDLGAVGVCPDWCEDDLAISTCKLKETIMSSEN